MTTPDTNHDKVVIPDTAEARSLADRFAKFLALGASQSAGVSAADELARDPELHRVEQQNSDRSALTDTRNQVGSRTGDPEPNPELGVDYEQNVSGDEDEFEAVDARMEPAEGDGRDQEGDQLCMSY